MMKQIIIVSIVFLMVGTVSCMKKPYQDDSFSVEGTIQRIYASDNAVDLLDQDGVEWHINIPFDLPIKKHSETPVYFDQLKDNDFLSITGKRVSEHEIKAQEAWSDYPPDEDMQKEFTYSLFFANPSLSDDPNLCDQVFPVIRSLKGSIRFDSETRYNIVLTELLQGPTQKEAEENYITSLPQDADFQTISLDPNSNTCTIDFTSLPVAGSCNVQTARKQIEETFMQFEEIQHVRILLNGSESEALQP